MKAATGELNLTVITLIAISAVIAFFWFMWPTIKQSVGQQWNDISDKGNDKDGNNPVLNGGDGFIVVDNYVISFNK